MNFRTKLKKVYAGVGSQKTPEWACIRLAKLAYVLSHQGYVCQSGLARGSDYAFYIGIKAYCEEYGLDLNQYYRGFIPHNGFNNFKKGMPGVILIEDNKLLEHARRIAQSVMSASHWANCSDFAKSAHTRNSFQMYGPTLSQKVGEVFCWAPPTGKGIHVKGGTGQAVRIADRLSIPVTNLATIKGKERIDRIIDNFLANGYVFPPSLDLI